MFEFYKGRGVDFDGTKNITRAVLSKTLSKIRLKSNDLDRIMNNFYTDLDDSIARYIDKTELASLMVCAQLELNESIITAVNSARIRLEETTNFEQVATRISNFTAFDGEIRIDFIKTMAGSALIHNLDQYIGTYDKNASTLLMESAGHKIRVYRDINQRYGLDEKKLQVTVISGTYTVNTIRKTIALVPDMLAQLGHTIPDRLKTIFDAYAKDDADTFVKIYQEIIKEHFNTTKLLNKQLKAILQGNTEDEIKRIRNSIDTYRSEINEYLTAVDNKYKSIESLEAKEFYLTYKLKEEDITTKLQTLTHLINVLNEKYDFDVLKIDESEMIVECCAPLMYYNPKDLEIIIKNRGAHAFGDDDDLMELMKRTFIENKYQLYTHAATKLRKRGHQVGYYTDATSDRCIPHPHLMRYNCFGDNERLIRDALRQNNLELAIEQTMAATYNINFQDGAVFGALIAYLKRQHSKPTFKDVATGKFISLDDFTVLRAEEAKAAEETEETVQPEIATVRRRRVEGDVE